MSDYTPSRLLAGRDRLGRIEKDAILANVLADVAPARKRAWWWFAVPAIAVAALVALLVIPRGKDDEFGVKGGGEAMASFTPTCGASPCARGGKLLFDLHGTTGYRFFSAFGRDQGGKVIWYVTGRELERALKNGVLDETVLLGDEHAAGTYRVYGVLSQTPLDRDGIKALFDDTGRVRATPGVEVIEKELVVQ
ncbi:MAG: hypothetical protein M4D80_27065 [Myxococcota bacterium]|nr:hypothetical protein [Myxococcota bacterium]